MSKSNSKEKTLGPLFLNKGDGGLKTFEFEIQSGSYLREGGPIVHKLRQYVWEYVGIILDTHSVVYVWCMQKLHTFNRGIIGKKKREAR